MSSVKRFKVLFDAATASTGSWFALDSRYDESPTRAIQIDLTVGDTVVIEGTTKDVKGTDKSFLTTLSANEISILGSYTASDADVLEGPWTYIRVRKTGTTGPAKVQGFI